LAKQMWERLEGERSKAYHYFCLYRDMGIDRSQNKLRDALAESGFKISRTRLNEMCTRYSWVSRAEAWDDHIAAQMLIEQEEEVKKMYKEYASLGRALASSGYEKLKADKDNPDAISASEARKRIKEGFSIEAKARGVQLEKEELDVSGKLNIVFTDDLKDA